jgi:hypothetical protein
MYMGLVNGLPFRSEHAISDYRLRTVVSHKFVHQTHTTSKITVGTSASDGNQYGYHASSFIVLLPNGGLPLWAVIKLSRKKTEICNVKSEVNNI